MKKHIISIIAFLLIASGVNYGRTGRLLVQQKPPEKKYLLITDQTESRILIADAATGKIVWDWRASESGMPAASVNWFLAPSDAKSVYNGKYVLLNASKGGVALVRISDKKAVFYGYAGGNTHSAELLPDGNIVSASSTGNFLKLFPVDTLHLTDSSNRKKIFIPFGHNVVWDKKRQVLWSAGRNKLYSYKYNFNCRQPDLALIDSTILPDNEAHDLYPIYGKDALWLTTPKATFTIDPSSRVVTPVKGPYTTNIKSVSSGPAGFPTIVMLPKEQWWSDEVLDDTGKSIFKMPGLKIYKARWLLTDVFSYPENNSIKTCK